jgi:hypothetical protein
LRANQKYTLLLVNEVLGLQATAQISVAENEVMPKVIDMQPQQPAAPPQRRGNRNRAGGPP